MKNFLVAFLMVYSSSGFSQVIIGEPEMVLVAGGSFEYGSNTGEKNEQPAHTVTLDSFYIGKYEVTQALWFGVMGENPSYFRNCNDCPVEEVTPAQVDTFLVYLSRLMGKHYRLPTEAEWEYAAMGGNRSKGYRYPGSDSLYEVAWMKDNASDRTHQVGMKRPNELFLYDMAGNVWELCQDWWNPAYYKKSPSANP